MLEENSRAALDRLPICRYNSLKIKQLERSEMKKISKSVQFSDSVIEDLSTLATSLGFSRLREGDEVGDVSKIVQRAVDFMLDNEAAFRQWLVNGSAPAPKSGRSKK